MLSFVAASLVVMTTPLALYAQEAHGSSMMRNGMMGQGHMMDRMSRIMDDCAAMMRGAGGQRPNEQWRSRPPTNNQ
jgi:hypothetical protein